MPHYDKLWDVRNILQTEFLLIVLVVEYLTYLLLLIS
ncbi:hypothetical protein CTH30272_03871 [Allocatenococcus thiocycli]|nr:hypothetical protein CTH30272_03871 [Catenococcus thiocycli]